MAIHSSILAWEIPWTEDPDRLQSMGSQRVKHGLVTKQQGGLSRKGLYLLISQKRAVGGDWLLVQLNQSSDDVLALFPSCGPSVLPSSGMAVSRIVSSQYNKMTSTSACIFPYLNQAKNKKSQFLTNCQPPGLLQVPAMRERVHGTW